MNRKIIIGFIIILLLGGFYFSASNKLNKTNDHGEQIDNNPVVQSHRSYSFNLLSSSNAKPNQETQIRYKITDDTGAELKNFSENHSQIMHFIIVRTDLQNFQHLHPDFNKNTGEFTVPAVFSDNGKYRLFADFVPAQGQKDPEGNYLGVTSSQDINVGDVSKYSKQAVLPDTKYIKTDEGYEFSYSIPQPIEAGKAATIVLNVKKNGQPVTNMEGYLGAQAHGILLKKDSLKFSHLHAMGEEMTHTMGGEKMTMHGPLPKGPEIKFNYTFPESGVYKLFTQFQVVGKVITTDYTLQVKQPDDRI